MAEKGDVYVLDEPTTGLHLADVENLLGLLDRLVDSGKSVIVIEHHQAVMAHADWIIDLGPGAGHDGGTVVFEGTPADLVADASTLTGQHLRYVGEQVQEYPVTGYSCSFGVATPKRTWTAVEWASPGTRGRRSTSPTPSTIPPTAAAHQAVAGGISRYVVIPRMRASPQGSRPIWSFHTVRARSSP